MAGRVRARHLTFDEERRLMTALKKGPLCAVVIVSIHAGLRYDELLNLRKQDVDFNRNVINVKNSMDDQRRAVPMELIVRKTLLKLCRQISSERIFVNHRTGAMDGSVKKTFAAACRAAGIYPLTFHDLRYTFGVRLAARGANASKINELIGCAEARSKINCLSIAATKSDK
jgi:integrase